MEPTTLMAMPRAVRSPYPGHVRFFPKEYMTVWAVSVMLERFILQVNPTAFDQLKMLGALALDGVPTRAVSRALPATPAFGPETLG